ncbi:hypothetical protein IFR05_013088 [Cadophora sp. M221]|nr:hypothetical protein IFR05_013088 [Cadophora sp. M221]
MSSSVTIGIDKLPEEIQYQIIRNIPVVDLPKVQLATRTFYRLARPYLYQCIHYIDGSQPSGDRDVASVRYHDRAFNHQYSARIVRLSDFGRAITESPALVSFIKQASFLRKEI